MSLLIPISLFLYFKCDIWTGSVGLRLTYSCTVAFPIQKRMEHKRDHHRDEDQGLQRSDSHYTAVWRWSADRLPEAYQKSKQLPNKLHPKASKHSVAGEDTLHRGPHPCRPAQRLHNAHKITTLLGRTQCTYERPPTPQETAIWRATGRKVLPQCPKEVIQGQIKGLCKDICNRHWLLESWSTGQMVESHSPQLCCEASRTNAAEQCTQVTKEVLCSCQHPLPTLPKTLSCMDRLDKSPSLPPYKSNPSPTEMRWWSSSIDEQHSC